MAQFKFELESVLDIRNFEQKQAESELAKALAEENRINEDLKTIALQYTQAKSGVSKSSDFNDILAFNNYQKLLDYQKEELLKQLAEAKLVSEAKRQIVLECMKKTTALEKMKEAKKAEFTEEQKLKEKKQLEEQAAIKSCQK